MAPKGGSVLNEPRSAVEIAESLKSCRDLIRVADVQIDKAKSDKCEPPQIVYWSKMRRYKDGFSFFALRMKNLIGSLCQ